MRSLAALLALALPFATALADPPPRPRLRELGVAVGILPPGPGNAITDVAGVRVGHATRIEGESIRTGVTAVVPHAGNLFREKVPGAVVVGNGFGKLVGSTQVNELGQIETPILLTSTLSTFRVADALVEWMLELPGNERVLSVNPLVAETNDGRLNDIRSRPVGKPEVLEALRAAREGAVPEGSVGAGTGTVAFGWKGGIGTASRRLPAKLGGWTVGALVQSNFGGVLSIAGAPVGVELGRHVFRDGLQPGSDRGDGSIVIVVATDAPVDAAALERIGRRALMGLARTGAAGTNGSGDYAIAFSTHRDVRIEAGAPHRGQATLLATESLSPLFLATIEATEEAIYNSLLKATGMAGNGVTVEAIPIDGVIRSLRRHGLVPAP